jgi:hypothetical protein
MVRSAPITEGAPLAFARAAGADRALAAAACGVTASLGGATPGLPASAELSLSGFFVNI